MFVPEPVISLSIRPEGNETPNFSRALNRFQKEDPTFRVHVDSESQETIISGMGELHLDIYVERMKREYGVTCVTGKPRVAFRETITSSSTFDYVHKKQSGGAGQFGKVKGYLEPMEMDPDTGKDTSFENRVVGGNIPTQYIPAIEKVGRGGFSSLHLLTITYRDSSRPSTGACLPATPSTVVDSFWKTVARTCRIRPSWLSDWPRWEPSRRHSTRLVRSFWSL